MDMLMLISSVFVVHSPVGCLGDDRCVFIALTKFSFIIKFIAYLICKIHIISILFEPPQQKTNNIHRRKQRRRSAVQQLHS